MTNSVQNALAKIQDTYNEEVAVLNHLAGDEKGLANDEQIANHDLNNEHYTTSHWSWGGCDESTGNVHTRQSMVSGYNQMEGKIGSLQGKIASMDHDLEELDTSADLGDLLGALNSIGQGISVTVDQDYAAENATEYLDSSDLKNAIDTLTSMIEQQLQIDEDLDEVSAGSKNVESLDMQAISDESAESASFNTLSNTLTASLATYTKTAGTAQTGEYKSNAVTQVVGSFGWNDSNRELREAEKKQREATRALNAIVSAQSDLSEVGADMAVHAFNSSLLSVENILLEVQQILSNPHLSVKAKEAKLAQCLQLILGLVQVILQTAENLRSKNKQKMAEANIVAQKLNIEKMNTLNQIFEEVQKQEHDMGICQKVLMGVEIAAAIALAVSGSIGVAIALITITSLDATNTTKHWTDDLRNDLHHDGAKNSKLDADAIMTSVSVLGTMGAGALIDQIVDRVTAAIAAEEVATAMQSSQEIIKTVAEKAAQAAISQESLAVTPEAEAAMVAAAEGMLRQTAEDAAKTAAENAVRVFAKRSAAEILQLRVRQSVAIELRRAVGSSVQEAIEASLKTSEEAAVKAALAPTESALQTAAPAEMSVKEIVKNAAAKALDTILTAVKGGNFKSSLWAGVYTAASTNMVVDIASSLQSRYHKIPKKDFEEIIQTCMQVVQMLMQAAAMLKGGEFMGGDASNPIPLLRGVQRASNIAIMGSLAGNSAMDFQQFNVQMHEANAVRTSQEIQAFLNFLHSYSEDQDKEASQTNAGISQEQKRLTQEQLWLSAHMWDSVSAGCQVLASKSV